MIKKPSMAICLSCILDGLIGLWPLNEEHQGKNLISGKTAIELYDVTYYDASDAWTSTPVRFSGPSTSYGQFINIDDVKLTVIGSFAFIAAVYREETGDFPLLEYSSSTHIWVHQNKLYINVVYASCGNYNMFYSSTVNNNQWYEVWHFDIWAFGRD